MAILKRPMFRKGGSANSGIMDGLERRNYAESNWEDIAATYGQNTSTYGARNPLNYLDPDYIEKMKEAYTPTEKDWSWLKPKKRKITTSSGEEVWLEGGIPMEEEDLIQMAPEFVTMPFPQDGKIPPPPLKKKKDDGGIDSVTVAEAKETASDLNKKYMQMMAPHMQKRMVADAWGAASRSFEGSTGDTKQDIARALGAAGEAMGSTKDIYDKVSMLTLQGEIQKDIEASKTQKLSNYEFLYNKAMSKNPKDKAWAKGMLKNDPDLKELVDGLGKSSGYRRFVTETVPNVKGTFAGDDASLKKLKTEELEDGKYYLGPPKDQFITIEGGKITKRESGLE